ncbi:ArsR/SmtB family transcription factor [Planctomicrobium sp. SH661]|uniref:ArsR/SmtB family transcription factor n=1 Tax=Planctomicrobium sp. SH661 TaxID=3448124 RepID=UPI003F5C8DFA
MKQCRTPLPLKNRSLLSPIQAGGLAAVFKVLASDTRLRLLHALIKLDEVCVTDLAQLVGMKVQTVSNQLRHLSDLGILVSRKEGPNAKYKVIDICVQSLLEQGLCLMEEAVAREPLSVRSARCCAED